MLLKYHGFCRTPKFLRLAPDTGRKLRLALAIYLFICDRKYKFRTIIAIAKRLTTRPKSPIRVHFLVPTLPRGNADWTNRVSQNDPALIGMGDTM
ncbi:MAG: hypothetical protein ACRESZ_03320 [Methylococcales bacterium]